MQYTKLLLPILFVWSHNYFNLPGSKKFFSSQQAALAFTEKTCNLTSYTTLCHKKVPTFNMSVTLSNLNQFSKFLHCWKAYKICYKNHDITHLTLGMLPHYLGELKIQIYCRY